MRRLRPMLPITLTIAGAAAILNLWLMIRIAQVRHASKVMTGDGNVPALIARMRAQANFVETAPFVLILLGLLEHAGAARTALWGAGIAFIVGRVVHPFGMDRPAPNPLRGLGAAAAIR